MKYVRLILVMVILLWGSSLWAAGTLSNGVFDYSDDSGVFGIRFTFGNSELDTLVLGNHVVRK